MATKFSELRAKLSPERRKKNRQRANELLADMALAELRKAHDATQQEIAESLGIQQSAVSQMEHRTDATVSALRRYVEATGGELVLLARYPDGDVRIRQFDDS